MIKIGREPLFRPRISRFGVGATHVSADDAARLVELFERPNHVVAGETPTFPIRNRLVRHETIHVNRHVYRLAIDRLHKLLESFPPIGPKNRTAPFTLSDRAIIGPRVHFQSSASLRSTVSKYLAGPPTFEISATPDADFSNVW